MGDESDFEMESEKMMVQKYQYRISGHCMMPPITKSILRNRGL